MLHELKVELEDGGRVRDVSEHDPARLATKHDLATP